MWCLDPFGVSGRPVARYNPLAWLDAASPDIAEDAQTIADALVHDAAGQTGEAHWNEEAKALVAGIILHTVVREPPALATLATVRDKLTRDPAGFAALLTDMQASTGAHGLIARPRACYRPPSARPTFSTAPASWTARRHPTSSSQT